MKSIKKCSKSNRRNIPGSVGFMLQYTSSGSAPVGLMRYSPVGKPSAFSSSQLLFKPSNNKKVVVVVIVAVAVEMVYMLNMHVYFLISP